MKNISLTEGNIGKALMMFVLPLFLGSLIQQLYIMADAVIVGQFAGKVGLAAIDSVMPIFKFPLNFMNGLASGATIIISRYYGENNKEGVSNAVHNALKVAIVLGVICSAAGVIVTPLIMNVMSVPDEIFDQTLIYMRIYFAGLWSMVLYNIGAGVMRAFGDSKRPLYVLMVCSAVNIVGDLVLVGGLKMGVAGAALATVAAQIISVIIVLRMLRSFEHLDGEGVVYEKRIGNTYMANMIKLGMPLALQGMLFPISNSIAQAAVNTMGTDNIAAWAVCDKVGMLIWLVADSMGPAITTYVAQNLGAKKIARVKRGTFIGMGMSAITVAALSLVFFFATEYMAYWFVSAKDAGVIVPLVTYFMKGMAPFYFFYAIGEAFSGACCGLGHTLASMITTMLSICVLRVVAIFFVLPHYANMTCIIWIYAVSWIVLGASFTCLFLFKSRKLAIE